MPSTIKLQDTVNWVRTHADMTPIVGVGGFSSEPALTICNGVLQKILGFPFAWGFNRKAITPFDTVNKQQEYVIASVLDIGWLERAQREEKASTATPKPIFDMECVRNLPKEYVLGVPSKVCKDRETTTDTILRVWLVPSSVIWTLYVDYQIKAPLKTTLSQTWSPLPDEMSHVCNQGVLTAVMKMNKDPRYPVEQKLFDQAIARAMGLDDAEQQHEGFFPERSIMLG